MDDLGNSPRTHHKKRSGRPLKIPLVGDISPKATAQRMGITEERFADLLPNLLARYFPPPDPDTGNFCIEAVDAWRRMRHSDLFAERHPTTGALDAADIHARRKASGRR